MIINTALFRALLSTYYKEVQCGFVCRVQQQYEEERTNRLLQEEAVKFLWKQVSSTFSSLINSPAGHIAAIKHLCAAVKQTLTWKTEEKCSLTRA